MLYDREVTFKDRAIEFEVRKKLKKMQGPIMFSETINIYELEVISRGTKDLEGIENLVNLERLSLYSNNLNAMTLRHLSGLKHLKSLDLADNPSIMEIPAGTLDEMTELRELVLDETGIYTLDEIMMEKLINLEEILIEDNNIKNLNFLQLFVLQKNL